MEIINTVKKFPKISFENLIIHIQVNKPYVREETAKNFVRMLILDRQIKVSATGEVELCQ